jgi:hypothetical protein
LRARSLLALALAVAPVTVSSFLPGSAEAQTFSALRQAIAEASSTDESLATFYRRRISSRSGPPRPRSNAAPR